MKPNVNRLLVAPDKPKRGMIIINTEEKPQTGTVIKVGKDVKLKPKQRVLFNKHNAFVYKAKGETVLILREKDVFAVLT